MLGNIYPFLVNELNSEALTLLDDGVYFNERQREENLNC